MCKFVILHRFLPIYSKQKNAAYHIVRVINTILYPFRTTSTGSEWIHSPVLTIFFFLTIFRFPDKILLTWQHSSLQYSVYLTAFCLPDNILPCNILLLCQYSAFLTIFRFPDKILLLTLFTNYNYIQFVWLCSLIMSLLLWLTNSIQYYRLHFRASFFDGTIIRPRLWDFKGDTENSH